MARELRKLGELGLLDKMEKRDLKNRNLIFLFIGYFFTWMTGTLINYFLPFYLKETGMNILEIGALFTIGLALGSFVSGLLFSKIQKKIKLKTGLNLSSLFYFLASFIFFVIPTTIGIVISNIFTGIGKTTFRISTDVTMQHNSSKKNHKKISSYSLIIDSISAIVGLASSIILIKLIGFRISLLFFSGFAIISFFVYYHIKEETRFKIKSASKLPKIRLDLKLILLSEILYWLGLGASFSLVITFLVTDTFSGSIVWIAVLFIALYLSITITTLLTRKFLDKMNLYTSSILGMFILLFSALLVIFSRNIYFVLVAMILEGIGAGIWVPSKTALYWGFTKPELREIVSGYLNGLRVFASTIGPLVGGILVFYFNILAPFYFKVVIALTSIGIYTYLMRKRES